MTQKIALDPYILDVLRAKVRQQLAA